MSGAKRDAAQPGAQFVLAAALAIGHLTLGSGRANGKQTRKRWRNFMKRYLWLLGLLIVACGTGWAEEAAAPAPAHVMVAPAAITWGDGPAIFEKGMSFAVMSGDPSKPGLYVIRATMPAGYTIAPHWHPTDEHVTVLSGTFALGMGETFDKAALKKLPAGGYALLPAEMRHFAMAATEVTIQVHGEGPFALNYVNPADDPSTRAPAK
jgi:quercetin dioxygenase-like cupin family protein